MRTARLAFVGFCLLLSGLLAHNEARGAAPLTLVRQFTAASDRYQYVPFDVPSGTRQLRITYQYDKANGDNVVDLGLFEPGPLDLGTAAFRGYSGGARTAVTIDAATATPGYIPGPLPPGRWNVLLGLYKVGPRGVDVSITIELETSPAWNGNEVIFRPAVDPLATPSAVAFKPIDPRGTVDSSTTDVVPPAAARWYMGALHTHTVHSDGSIEPAELMRRFRGLGFEFVAITDHNNTTHRYDQSLLRDAAALPLWIAGEEVTTPGGHASVWGLGPGEWIDFRVGPGDPRIKDLVATAHRYGALFSVNHPVSACVACGWTHEFVDGIDAIEISNGQHGEVAAAVAVWDKLLRTGRRITAVGSSDWHRDPNAMDSANVRVLAPALTAEAILAAIRAGQVIVMRNAVDATPDIAVRARGRSARAGESLPVFGSAPLSVEVFAAGLSGSVVSVIHNGERAQPIPLDAAGRARIERPATPGYVRVEIHSPDGAPIAIANPVYLVAR